MFNFKFGRCLRSLPTAHGGRLRPHRASENLHFYCVLLWSTSKPPTALCGTCRTDPKMRKWDRGSVYYCIATIGHRLLCLVQDLPLSCASKRCFQIVREKLSLCFLTKVRLYCGPFCTGRTPFPEVNPDGSRGAFLPLTAARMTATVQGQLSICG